MTKTKMGAHNVKSFTAQVYTFLESHFYGILAVILGVGLLIFHPSVSSRIWSWQRDRVYNHFVSQVQMQQKIDAQTFWQFREFYSPGEFTFNPDAVGVYQTLRITTLSGPETRLLTFTAPHLISNDSIITTPDIYQQKIANIPEPLYQDESSVIYETDDNEVNLIFYLAIDEMMAANGFFDYLPAERELLQGKYWLNQTTLTRK